jgi:hypothetical protein
MSEVMKYRKIDAHEHVGLGSSLEEQLHIADRLYIEKLEISRPIAAGPNNKVLLRMSENVTTWFLMQ